MTKVYVLYDDPMGGAAQIYGVFKDKCDAEKRAYELSTSVQIWGPATREDWGWHYDVVGVDLE